MSKDRLSGFNPIEYRVISGEPADSNTRFSHLQKLAQRTKSIGRTLKSGFQSFAESILKCDMPGTAILATTTLSFTAIGLSGIGVGHLINNPDLIHYGNWIAAGSAIGGWVTTFSVAVFESDPDFNPNLRR